MIKILVPSILVFSLIGCGGSNGSKIVDDTSVKLSGIAVDDLILDGKVKAYSKENKLLAEGRTSKSNGSYTLNVDHQGLVVIEVTCDENSLMLNPATNKKIVCEKNLKLHSATVVEENSKEVEVNISPVSELVVKKMGENPTKDTFSDARAKVGLMFKLDPISNDPSEGDYAKVIDSIHEVAKDGNTTISKVISLISKDIEDDKAGEDNTTKLLISKMKFKQVANPLTQSDEPVALPDNIASMSDVEMAKNFFEELRKQSISFDEKNQDGFAGSLNQELEELSASFDNTFIDNIDTQTLAKTVVLIGDIAQDSDHKKYIDIDSSKKVYVTVKSDTEYSYVIKYDDVEKYSGNVILPKNINDIKPVGFNILQLKIDGTFPASKDSADASFTLKTDAKIVKTNMGAKLTLSDAKVESKSESYSLSNIIISADYDYNENPVDGEDDIKIKSIKLDSLEIAGQNEKYSISGKIDIPSYVVNSSISSKGFEDDEEEIYNSGVIPSKITFNGVIKGLKSDLKLDGNLNVEFLNAKSMDLTNNDQKVDIKASFSGKIKTPNFNELVSSVTYNNSNNRQKINLSYSYDGIVIDGKGDYDKEFKNGTLVLTNQSGLKAIIMTKDGEVVYDKNSNVTKDGRVIGEIQEREGAPVVKYIDGTFESIL